MRNYVLPSTSSMYKSVLRNMRPSTHGSVIISALCRNVLIGITSYHAPPRRDAATVPRGAPAGRVANLEEVAVA